MWSLKWSVNIKGHLITVIRGQWRILRGRLNNTLVSEIRGRM